MKNIVMSAVLGLSLSVSMSGAAWAKLPPPTDAEKAAAEAAKAKAADAAKKDAEALAKAQDRAVDNFKKGKGKASMAGAKK